MLLFLLVKGPVGSSHGSWGQGEEGVGKGKGREVGGEEKTEEERRI